MLLYKLVLFVLQYGFEPSVLLTSVVNLFLMSEVYMISDIIDLLHHFPYVFTLLLQDGLDALPLVGAEGDARFLRTWHLFHLSLLIVFFHSNLFDGIAQMSKLIWYQL